MKYLYDISVKGRVQGVGFRYFAKAKAKELHLTGFVRNSSYGKVRIEAEGERDDLEVFLDYLKIGPSMARVDLLEVSRAPFTGGYDDFVIRY